MRRIPALPALLVGCIGLSLSFSSPAPAGQGGDELKVMTWNLFVGVHFSEARKFRRSLWTLPQSIDRLFGQVAENDFGVRARVMGAEIERQKPDVICLQEMALWRRATGRVFDPGDLGTPVVDQDFLAILLAELGRRGLKYRPAVVSHNEDVRVPSLRYGQIRLTDRNAILVNERIQVEAGDAGAFEVQREVRWLTFRFRFQRGWVSADLRRGDERFRVYAVHLALDPKIKRAQVEELMAMVKGGDLPAVVAGDFNLNPDRLGWLRKAFRRAGLRDTWRVAGKGPGGTCCQAKPLTRPRSSLPARVDLILASKGSFGVRSVRRVGADQTARPRFPDGKRRWISDHAGVLARLVIRSSPVGPIASRKR